MILWHKNFRCTGRAWFLLLPSGKYSLEYMCAAHQSFIKNCHLSTQQPDQVTSHNQGLSPSYKAEEREPGNEVGSPPEQLPVIEPRLYLKVVSFSSQTKLSHTQIDLLYGFNSNFWQASPTWEFLPGQGRGYSSMLAMWVCAVLKGLVLKGVVFYQ